MKLGRLAAIEVCPMPFLSPRLSPDREITPQAMAAGQARRSAPYRNERSQRRSMRFFHHQIQRPCALHAPRSAIA